MVPAGQRLQNIIASGLPMMIATRMILTLVLHQVNSKANFLYEGFRSICSLNGDVNDIDKLRKTSDKVNDTLFGVAASIPPMMPLIVGVEFILLHKKSSKKLPSLQRHA